MIGKFADKLSNTHKTTTVAEVAGTKGDVSIGNSFNSTFVILGALTAIVLIVYILAVFNRPTTKLDECKFLNYSKQECAIHLRNERNISNAGDEKIKIQQDLESNEKRQEEEVKLNKILKQEKDEAERRAKEAEQKIKNAQQADKEKFQAERRELERQAELKRQEQMRVEERLNKERQEAVRLEAEKKQLEAETVRRQKEQDEAIRKALADRKNASERRVAVVIEVANNFKNTNSKPNARALLDAYDMLIDTDSEPDFVETQVLKANNLLYPPQVVAQKKPRPKATPAAIARARCFEINGRNYCE